MTNVLSAARARVASPIGDLLLRVACGKLTAIDFAHQARDIDAPEIGDAADPLLVRVAAQLAEYFEHRRTTFDVALDPAGTPFQQRVWQALMTIPFGETVSYAEIAQRIGQPRAVRAVGLANGRNPIPILIPCHRVIGADGSLTGYAGGLAIKRALLELEGAAACTTRQSALQLA
jgi:methylated-DNA-[protein]-cysteine S-methyltransferase